MAPGDNSPAGWATVARPERGQDDGWRADQRAGALLALSMLS